MLRFVRFISCLIVAVGLLVVVGCSTDTNSPPAKNAQDVASKKDDAHGHKPGKHGGLIVAIDRDNYHAEAFFGKDGTVRFYTLGRDEARVQEIEAQPVSAFARVEGDANAQEIQFQPQRQPGDAPGKTSLLVAKLPAALVGKKVEITLQNLRIGDERFRVSLPVPEDHGGPPASDLTMDEERTLFLTPGGKYTTEDITRNGRQVASEKFKGLKANHDLKAAPGEAICPITLTKANPQFSWIIGGESYPFCCPPCVDEFVRLAKDRPDDIKAPAYYHKKK